MRFRIRWILDLGKVTESIDSDSVKSLMDFFKVKQMKNLKKHLHYQKEKSNLRQYVQTGSAYFSFYYLILNQAPAHYDTDSSMDT